MSWNHGSSVLINVLIVAVLAGCTGSDEDLAEEKSKNEAHGEAQGEEQGQIGPGDEIGPDEVGSNETDGEDYYDPGWPALEDATIRPGGYVGESQIVGAGYCTYNFVFRSPDNETLYVGSAAHCFRQPADMPIGPAEECHERNLLPLGTEILISGASKPGELIYSSWLTMVERKESDQNICNANDFALIEIHEDDRGSVHPAMYHFGGPDGMKDSDEVVINSLVYSYGRSSFHLGLGPLELKEGYVNSVIRDGWETRAYMVNPGVWGDSGSPVVTQEGKALGVLVTLNLGVNGVNGIANLDKMLGYMHEHTDLEVELATWDLLDEGALPEWPL